jgi:hypothetical protein
MSALVEDVTCDLSRRPDFLVRLRPIDDRQARRIGSTGLAISASASSFGIRLIR